ncbi:hypothetical protein F4820DRAFT_447703 [Hypoxylon rubiginosum]|uniref:Uncharacterized protein n=1 Tax=Hypoxylon rubiginosum TaxID=110542 RepID=A0ACB9Z201_9PEZI|nr:hypothetical protein F4820DRAFT_447703 [Hypoxylon rubiginosum]
MNNFGVIELAAARKTNAPGWAYVPDTAPSLAAAATSLQPGNRKRAARNQGGGASTSALYADADARQEAKLRREIEALDRDNYHRDAGIPIPASARRDNKGVKKHTPNVRKILQSQKTFANHLDDFHALPPQDRLAPVPTASTAATTTQTDKSGGNARPSRALRGGEKEKEQPQKNKKKARSSSRSASISKATPLVKQEDADVEMLDATATENEQAPPPDSNDSTNNNRSEILAPYSRPGYPPLHERDGDPLLTSRVPPPPTDAELRALFQAPPLTYAEARGRWINNDGDNNKRYPARAFCEVCGYWGRVRCMKCGVRVCALDCLETHREECVTRYGL